MIHTTREKVGGGGGKVRAASNWSEMGMRQRYWLVGTYNDNEEPAEMRMMRGGDDMGILQALTGAEHAKAHIDKERIRVG